VDAVLIDLHLVGHEDERVELHAELVLGGGHLVVVLLDLHAHGLHGGQHLAAHVLRGIERRTGK
jgi:hypothetical protein